MAVRSSRTSCSSSPISSGSGFDLREPAGAQVQAPTQAGLTAISADPGLSATNFGVFKQFVPVGGAAERVPALQRGAGEWHLRGGFGRAGFGFHQHVPHLKTSKISCRALTTTYPDGTRFAPAMFTTNWTNRYPGRELVILLHRPAIPVESLNPQRIPHVQSHRSLTNFELASIAIQYLPDGGFKFPGLDAFPNLIFMIWAQRPQRGPGPQLTAVHHSEPLSGRRQRQLEPGRSQLSSSVSNIAGTFRRNSFTQRQRGDYDLQHNTTLPGRFLARQLRRTQHRSPSPTMAISQPSTGTRTIAGV